MDYITELQQVVESLEAKKQRKVYNEVLISPRKPGLLSPRISYPISPTTPQPTTTSYNSAARPLLPTPTGFLSSSSSSSQLIEPPPSSCSPATTSSSSVDSANELAANSKSEIAEVEVKFSGENVVVKTVSPHIPGQAVKIISALEDLSLEILHVSITAINDHTMLNSFTIKVTFACTTDIMHYFFIAYLGYLSTSGIPLFLTACKLGLHFFYCKNDLFIPFFY